MEPPQEKPAHPVSMGAVIWRMASKGASETSGMAMPKVTPEAEVYEAKQRPRSSQYV
jgi:hypothetical protein